MWRLSFSLSNQIRRVMAAYGRVSGLNVGVETMASDSQIQLFKTLDGEIQLDVSLSDETIWLSLGQVVALFERDKSVISRHNKKYL